nr:zinc finger protein JACKDAW-like [Ipomoea batatas]
MATNRFICEICNKGFQTGPESAAHGEGTNLPMKLSQRNNKEVDQEEGVYMPEKSCVHHDRLELWGTYWDQETLQQKAWEKKWKCDKCSKKYAVQSDWKAHSKFVGLESINYCGTLFSRKTAYYNRAFCDAIRRRRGRGFTTSVPNLNFRNECNHWVHGSAARLSSSLPPVMKEEDAAVKIAPCSTNGGAAQPPPPAHHVGYRAFAKSRPDGLRPERQQY